MKLTGHQKYDVRVSQLAKQELLDHIDLPAGKIGLPKTTTNLRMKVSLLKLSNSSFRSSAVDASESLIFFTATRSPLQFALYTVAKLPVPNVSTNSSSFQLIVIIT